MINHMVFGMERKLREISGSLVVSVPCMTVCQVMKVHSLQYPMQKSSRRDPKGLTSLWDGKSITVRLWVKEAAGKITGQNRNW